MDRIRLEFITDITPEVLQAVTKGIIKGSRHWCCQMKSFEDTFGGNAGGYMANSLQDNIPLILHDDIESGWMEIDLHMVLNGIKMYLEHHPEDEALKFTGGRMLIDAARLSDDAADSILQYASFGHIKYKGGVKLY